jgi:aromatic-L-amino-acid decarboxylase
MSLACPEYREMGHLESINRFAHSFCTNFHKVRQTPHFCLSYRDSLDYQWGLTNFDASSLWVRDRTSLTDALDATPEYLRTKHGEEGEAPDVSMPLKKNNIVGNVSNQGL